MRAAVVKAIIAILAALVLAGCSARPSPRCVVMDGGDTVWYGPTCDVARARARWYADPSWRVPANIPALGY